jgi:hypothetical protein
MNRYQKIIKYTKPLVEIDEKIRFLDEKMTTSGIYAVVDQDDGLDEVPPTFEPAPLGDFADLDNFSWADQGDGSSDTVNVSQLVTTDVEGNEQRIFDMPDLDYPTGTPLAMAIGPNQAVTGNPLGYITSSGFVHVYQINNVFSVAHTDFSRAFVEYYENNSFTQKTIYMWGPLLYRVTTAIEATEYYPSDRDFDSDPQAEKGLYGYTLLVPAKMNSIKTDIGVRARPPRVNNVISRNDIGDPNYYPGPINQLINLGQNVVNFGKGVIDFISGMTGSGAVSGGGLGPMPPLPPPPPPPPPPPEDSPPPPPPPEDTPPPPPPPPPPEDEDDDRPLIPLGYDENGNPTGFTRLNPTQMEQFKDGGGDAAIREGKTFNEVLQQGYENRKNAFTDFTSGISDGMTVLSQVQDTLKLNRALGNIEPPSSEGERSTIKEGEKGSSTNPIQTDLSDSSMNALQNAVNNYDPRVDGDLTSYLNKFTSTSDNLGLKSSHNNIQDTEIRGDDIIIKDTYGFGASQDIYNKPVVKQVSDAAEVIVNALGGDGKEASEQVQTIFDQAGPVGAAAGLVASGGESLLPGKDDAVVHFETVIPGGAKNLGSNFQTTNQPVKESTLFEKWKKKPEPKPSQLKLIYNYFYYLPETVKKMILMDMKVETQIMMLSPDERSFREKELRNTLINKHHELYMDEKFSENVEQTSRIKKILARNIKLSDPKTFKDPKPALTYGKVFGDDPKNKKVKEKNFRKKSAGRFFKTEKKVDTSRIRWLKG